MVFMALSLIAGLLAEIVTSRLVLARQIRRTSFASRNSCPVASRRQPS